MAVIDSVPGLINHNANGQLRAEPVERMRVAEALRAAEMRCSSLTEQIPAVTYSLQIVDAQPILYFSPQLKSLLGYQPDQFTADPSLWINLVHPEDQPRLLRRFAQLSGQQAEPSFDYRICSADGREVWLQDESHVIQIDSVDGRKALQGVLLDITPRKVAERELFHRIELERLITAIASDFINVGSSNIDNEISRALAVIGTFAGVDRSYVFLIDDEHQTMSNTHEWCAAGISPEIDNLQHLPVAIFPWVIEQLSQHNFVHVPRVGELPPEAAAEREILELQAIRSVVWVPIASETRLIGFLGFDAVRAEKSWDLSSIALLQFVGTIFANALQRQRMDRALRASELQYRTVVEQVGEVIFQTDAAGHWTFLNPAWEEITGFSAEDSLGSAYLEFVYLEDRERGRELFASLMAGQTDHCRCELRFRTSDGGYRWIETFARLWLDDAGNIVGTSGTLSDLTRHKYAEEVLRESELRFRQLAENIRDVFFISAPDMSQFFYISPAYEEVWGRSCASLYEWPRLFLEQIHPDDRAEILHGLARQMRGGEDLNVECRLSRDDGSERWIKIRAFAVRGAQGAIYRLTGIVEEITERKRVESTLLRSNADLERMARMKDEFLASMSHELRTPLNAILGLTEVLQGRIYGPVTAQQQGALINIEESGRHLLALINDILDLSKIEASQLTLELAPLQIDELCQTSIRLVKQVARRKDITTSLTLDPRIQTFVGDERRLKQILVNLLSNAVKFTPEGGRVGLEVMAGAGDELVSFTVWDTGIGITPDDQRRLFQPFVQLDSRLAREHEGTGLGLALVRNLARLHGGEVELESALGAGSRFTVTIPWQRPMNELPTSSETASNPADSLILLPQGQPLILVAEDNALNCEVIVAYLHAQGFRTHVVTSGIAVVEQVRAMRPVLILMDIQMPEMDGVEAIKRVRATPEICSIPIIAVTALAMHSDRERCLKAGANEYLSKPLRLKELRRHVVRLLEQTSDTLSET